jgi:peptidoglycan/LPS O-acetylase OafA/YrhL
MTALIGTVTGIVTTFGAPFLIQLFKRKGWKGTKARWFAFGVAAVAAIVWVLFSGAAGTPDTTGVPEFVGWLLGAVTVTFTTATGIYKWFEEKVFKKIPNLASLVTGK